MKPKLISTMNTILVFKNGELLNQITYKTKTEAKKHYLHFKKNGMMDISGKVMKDANFELL